MGNQPSSFSHSTPEGQPQEGGSAPSAPPFGCGSQQAGRCSKRRGSRKSCRESKKAQSEVVGRTVYESPSGEFKLLWQQKSVFEDSVLATENTGPEKITVRRNYFLDNGDHLSGPWWNQIKPKKRFNLTLKKNRKTIERLVREGGRIELRFTNGERVSVFFGGQNQGPVMSKFSLTRFAGDISKMISIEWRGNAVRWKNITQNEKIYVQRQWFNADGAIYSGPWVSKCIPGKEHYKSTKQGRYVGKLFKKGGKLEMEWSFGAISTVTFPGNGKAPAIVLSTGYELAGEGGEDDSWIMAAHPLDPPEGPGYTDEAAGYAEGEGPSPSAPSSPGPGGGGPTEEEAKVEPGAVATGQQPGSPRNDPDDIVAKLERLKVAKEKGLLTDEEYSRTKAKLLEKFAA